MAASGGFVIPWVGCFLRFLYILQFMPSRHNLVLPKALSISKTSKQARERKIVRREYSEVRRLAGIYCQDPQQAEVSYISIRVFSVGQYSPFVVCSVILQQMKDMGVNKAMLESISTLTEWCGQQCGEWEASFLCPLFFGGCAANYRLWRMLSVRSQKQPKVL